MSSDPGDRLPRRVPRGTDPFPAEMPATEDAEVIEVAALVHELEVHQAELELHNAELARTNDELRRANEELVVARDRYRSLHDLAPTAYVTLDAAGSIVDVNRAAEILLRTPRRRLITGCFELFIADAGRAAFRALIDDTFVSGHASGGEAVLSVDGAPSVDVLLDGIAIRHAAAGPERCVLSIVDISARKRTEEERRALERRMEQGQKLESLGVLAGGIAHDFNNLLAIVLGRTDLALRQLGPDAESAPALAEVIEAAKSAGQLAHQMLAYSGRVSAPCRPTQVAALLRELEPLIRASTRAASVALAFADDLPTIHADASQIRQALLELVVNAAEAIGDGPGSISVAVRAESLPDGASRVDPLGDELRPGRYVVVEITDDGPGMDPSTAARIFEPYFSTRFTGRGLGLAVVQGIVRGHHGAITVTSTPGVGTSFRVYLPASPAPTAPRPAPRPIESAWHASGTALLVDDDRGVSRAFAAILASMGFTVLTAYDGLEAIEVFRAEGGRIDLVLMDLTMPRMGGVDAGRALHAMRRDVPIVLVTGYGELPADSGDSFVGVLSKPFTIDGLVDVLRPLFPVED